MGLYIFVRGFMRVYKRKSFERSFGSADEGVLVFNLQLHASKRQNM